MGQGAIKVFCGASDQVRATRTQMTESEFQQVAGNAGSTMTFGHHKERQMGLDCAIGLEVCECNHSVVNHSDDGHNARREEY